LAAAGKLTFIRGVELQIEWPRGDFHLLGLNLTTNTGKLEERLTLQRRQREERNLIILDKINRHFKLSLNYSEVTGLAGGVVGRLHFAYLLVKLGKVKNVKVAFDKYLAIGRPCYEGKDGLPFAEAVSLIKEAGGKDILAHPMLLYLSLSKLAEVVATLKQQGLDGLEAYHSQVTVGKAGQLKTLAEQFNLIITGGSDYHGNIRKDRQLGYTCGQKLTIADELLGQLINYH